MSNRAPVRVVRSGSEQRIEASVGGVATTFVRLLEHHRGLWIAWPGGQRAPRRLPFPAGRPGFAMALVRLTARDVSLYYRGMCNQALWPLMHFMVSRCQFEPLHWRQYRHVNSLFAQRAIRETGADDVLWIQDFHLALTPAMIRARRVHLPMGLFWHVPFPPAELFRVFPWREEFLQGMLGADLIGFHVRSYATHFMQSCERVLGAETDHENGTIRFRSHVTRVGAFPLGIPADYFAELAERPRIKARAARIRRALGSEVVILSVDRLDYTKGILERLLGYERFLEQNPACHRRVTMVMITAPSRTKVTDYIVLKRQIDETVGRIIGRFSSDDWTPIRFLYAQVGPEELVAYYQACDIALLTPLRDGMNLIAKEFVASRPDDDAVLILSEFAGAAEELGEALLVNPYDTGEIALRIRQALELGADARSARMRALREKVRINTLEHWAAEFLAALATESELEPRASAPTGTD